MLMTWQHTQGGEIIRDLRNETGTKIKIEDPTPECEDRVVTIIGPDRQAVLASCVHYMFVHLHRQA